MTDSFWGVGSDTWYSEGGRAVHMGKELRVIRSLQREHLRGKVPTFFVLILCGSEYN